MRIKLFLFRINLIFLKLDRISTFKIFISKVIKGHKKSLTPILNTTVCKRSLTYNLIKTNVFTSVLDLKLE